MARLSRLAPLAARNVRRQLGRSAFVVAAIVLGVSALILAGGFIKDTIVELGDSIIYSHTGHVQLSRAGFREQAAFDPEAYVMNEADQLRESLESAVSVKQVLLRLYTSGLAGNGESDWPVFVEGVEADREAILGSYVNISAGRRLAIDDEFGALVGAGVAEALALAPGDWVDVVATTLDGSMNALEFEVVGVFQTFSKDYDAHAIRIPLNAAQELLGTGGANVLVMELHDTDATIQTSQHLISQHEGRGYEIATWDELDPFYRQAVQLYEQQFGFLTLVILGLVILGVGTAVSMGIHERAAEFATLRSVGTPDSDIAALILLETLMLGALGAFLGVLIGNLLAAIVSAIGIPMPAPPNSDLAYVSLVRHSTAVSALAFCLGALAPIIAALRPAWRCSREPIIDGLRQSV